MAVIIVEKVKGMPAVPLTFAPHSPVKKNLRVKRDFDYLTLSARCATFFTPGIGKFPIVTVHVSYRTQGSSRGRKVTA